MKKMKPKDVDFFVVIFVLVGLVFVLIGNSTSVVLSVIGGVFLVGGFLFRLLFYRCPHCGAYLDRSRGEYCPHCSKKVNE